MARKSFTQNNPALQFIDTGEDDGQQEQTPPPAPAAAKQERPAMTAPMDNTRGTRQLVAPGYERLAAFQGIGPAFKEAKTARLNLVLQPRLKAAIDAAAKSVHLSSNEFIAQIMKRELKAGGFLDE